MKYAVYLAEKYSRLNFQDLPENTVNKAKECILDIIGCIYAGFSFDSSRIVREYAIEQYGAGPCTVIGTDKKLVPPGASLANSTSGHGPELDDTSNDAVLHVGVIVVPTALAMAEKLGLSGKDVLTAMAAGYDVHIKVGKAANPVTHLAKGLHPTATCGMFGATITAARLMNMPAEQTANAFGIVGSFAAGNLECYSDGSYTKRIQPGIASSSGITAAMLAQRGYTGPKSIFEGPRGFFHAYCDRPDPEQLVKGETFEIENISFKPHACCRFNQTPIDAALEVCKKNGIDHRQIDSILIELSKTGYEIVGQPAEVKFNPQNVVDAQFSVPFSVAVACIERQAFLKEFSEEAIKRDDVRDLMKKVTIRHNTECDKDFPEAWPAKVTVFLKNGAKFASEVKYAKGDPQNPLSRDELLTKFNTIVSDEYLSMKNKGEMVSIIDDFENLKDIRDFTMMLSKQV